jgi:hypothetical protein
MHIEFSAYQVNLFAAAAAMFFAVIWTIAWYRVRYAYMLILAFGWLGLCAYWGLVAVVAGPEPPADFMVVVPFIRGALFGGIALLVVGKLALLRLVWKLRAEDE